MSSPPETVCTASRHGTTTAYQVDRCRCPDAVAAQGLYRRRLRWRHRRGVGPAVDAIGTRRRIHALIAIGWARADIMARLGYSDAGAWLTKAARVHRDTAERVAALYCKLSDTPGPSRQAVVMARRYGYLSPLWWDDDTIDDPSFEHPPWLLRTDRPSATTGSRSFSTRSTPSMTASSPDVDPVVIERLLDGQPPLHVTRAERAEAVRLLDQRGKTRSEIAVQLHMSGGRVAQILDRLVRPEIHTPTTDNDRQEASA